MAGVAEPFEALPEAAGAATAADAGSGLANGTTDKLVISMTLYSGMCRVLITTWVTVRLEYGFWSELRTRVRVEFRFLMLLVEPAAQVSTMEIGLTGSPAIGMSRPLKLSVPLT